MSFFDFDNVIEFSLLGRDIQSGAPASCYGLSDPMKYLIASMTQGRAVYITADALSAQRAAESVAALSDKRVALLPAKDEVLFYRKALSKDAFNKRLSALFEWQTGADIFVGDIEAFMGLVPARLPVFMLRTGQNCDMRKFAEELVRAGYAREYAVESKGVFALRGDILDIYPVNSEHPVRIDFFGDEIESIKPYDEITGERLPVLNQVTIASATDVVPEEGEEETLSAIFKKELASAPSSEARRRLENIFGEIRADGFRSEFLMPLLKNSACFFDVLGRDVQILFDETKQIFDRMEGLYKEHAERFLTLRESGEVASFSQDQFVPQSIL